MNDTTDIRLCHRCGGEGHIRKYCSINVHCDFCKSYSHHTSVCRSYANFVRAHPMASSRRTSPAHTTKQTDWIRAGTQEGKVEVSRQQKCEETNGEEEQPRRRDISEITRKHLERVISAMIPSSMCSISDPTENVPTNSLATQWGQRRKASDSKQLLHKRTNRRLEAGKRERDLAKYFKNPYTDPKPARFRQTKQC